MDKIRIIKENIINLKTDALVNAANEGLKEGAGVCGVIFKAAGSRELQDACDQIGGCRTGSAVITPGFRLKSKYIIHAVGPKWFGGNHNEAAQLRSAYQAALSLARQNKCRSVGFPLISAGIYGYPVEKAWKEAIQACFDFQCDYPDSPIEITFAVIDDKVMSIGKKILSEICKEYTTLFIDQLDEDSFLNIKHKLATKKDLIIDKKTQPMAYSLLDVLFDEKILKELSVKQIIHICESVFPPSVLEEGWAARYADMLVRVIDENKSKTLNDRAAKYEKYVWDVLVPALKKGTQSKDVLDDLEPLVDLYKVSACLLRNCLKKEKEFVFEACLEDMESLNDAILNIKGIGNNVLGIPLAPVRTEDRQYAAFLSWILEELLCKQDAVVAGGEY